MDSSKQNPLKEKSYDFSLQIIFLTKKMYENKEYVLAK